MYLHTTHAWLTSPPPTKKKKKKKKTSLLFISLMNIQDEYEQGYKTLFVKKVLM